MDFSKGTQCEQNIYNLLCDDARNYIVNVFDILPSTNDYLKFAAANGAKEGNVAIAKAQTAGKGRLDRRFYSPEQAGLYMSILLRPDIKTEQIPLITPAAAVAVAVAIEDISDNTAYIKWVNDIYINGKKVCGILTESSFTGSLGNPDFCVLGIGVNVIAPKNGYPPEIADTAAAVFNYGEADEDKIDELAAAVLNRFSAIYKNILSGEFKEEYKRRSFILGKDITVINGDTRESATAVDIDDDCNLVVRLGDGTTRRLIGGEVSIRPLQNL